jgi:hypothetical protein
MPQPTISDVHVNALLTNLSLMYAQSKDNFIAEKVFPIIPVTKKSDLYARFSRADFNRDDMQERGPGTEAMGTGYNIDNTASYTCKLYALKHDIDDQIRGNADSVFNLDYETMLFLTNKALINRERTWATTFFTSSPWTTQLTGVAGVPGANQFLQWNDPSSTPIVDVRATADSVQLASGGFRPNKCVMGRQTFSKLLDHPDFLDRIKYQGLPSTPAKVTRNAMAQLFELDEVLVMESVYNSAQEQAQTDSGGTFNAGESNSFIGGKSFLLVYTPDAPGLYTPGCGYTFAWTGPFGANQVGSRIFSYFIPQIRSQRIEIEQAYAHVVASGDMGAFFATAVA